MTIVDRMDCLSAEEQVCLSVIADMQAALLSAMLMPVYTIVKREALLDYFALPAIRLAFIADSLDHLSSTTF